MTNRTFILIITFLMPSYLFSAGTPQERTAVPRDTLITLQRFAGLFNGTDYKLTIGSDGKVVFTRFANHFVDRSDPRARAAQPIQAEIPIEKVAELIAEFERVKYFSLKDRYAKEEDGCPGVWTDQGGAIISLTANGKTKTIEHYHGCAYEPLGAAYPRELSALEDKIDEVVGTRRWLK